MRQAGEMEWRLCFISCGNSFVSLMGSKSRSGPPSPRSPCRRREAQKARGGGSLGWLGRSWLRGARGSRGGASLPYSTVPLSLGLPASLPSCSTLFLLAVEGKTSGPSASAVWALGRGNFSRFPSEQLNSQARKGKRVSTLSWRKWVCSICVLSGYHSPSSKTCSATQKLPGTCALGILWRLHRRGMISHQLYLQPFSFLKRRGSGAALLSPRK